MQAWLKRHPTYIDDYDSNSIVKKGSDLDKVIITFEEKSRNYTGIDFSKAIADPAKIAKAEIEMAKAEKLLEEATKLHLADKENKQLETAYNSAQEAHKKAIDALKKNKKVYKVLITGFDPFQLDPKYRNDINAPNTFNPTGIVALSFFDTNIGNIFIQTCIFPVRYEDFDAGIVEKVAKDWLPEVDMIMTTSLNSNTAIFDVEKYAIAFREGFHDNNAIGNSSSKYNDSRFISNNSKEIRETTLPEEKIFGKGNDTVVIVGEIVRYDTYKDQYEGSGGAYLSNEIMYRTTKLRDELKGSQYVGHFHLGNLKTNGSSDIKKSPIVLKVVETIISWELRRSI